MINRTIVFLFTLAGIFFSTSASGQTYDYVNLFNKRHTISIQISPAFFATGDLAIDAEFCGRGDFFICVTSEAFNFAVPIEKKFDVSKWDYRGYVYELKKQETLEVFGQTLKVWVIESTQGAKKLRYLYSKNRGLMAISMEMGGESKTFVSQKFAGFGNKIKGR